MKLTTATYLAIAVFTPLAASKAFVTSCSAQHGPNGYAGNEFTMKVSDIQAQQMATVCGNVDSCIRSSSFYGINYGGNACSTDDGARTMTARIKLDKQSWDVQSSFIQLCLDSAIWGGCSTNVQCTCSGGC